MNYGLAVDDSAYLTEHEAGGEHARVRTARRSPAAAANRRHRQANALGLVAFFGLLGSLALSRSASANGRYPKADQLLVAADAPENLLVRTTFGFLVSRDSGQNWNWICERAIGYSGVQDPTIGFMEHGTIIASLSEGIARSADRGCSWAFSEADLNGSPVIDLSVKKAAPSHALALVWDAQRVGYSSRILNSADNGRSFLPYGEPIDPSVLVTTLDTAPSNPHRVYASGTRSVNGVRSALLFESDDDGEHWSEHPLPFDPKLEQGVYIAAVDPKDADTVYVRTSSATVSRLLVSHDGGRAASAVYSGSLLAFALSPDGKRLYIGGEDGLYTGLASDWQFVPRNGLRVLCLAATAQTLYACSDEHSGFTVGASGDGGFTFEPLLHLQTVRGPLACNAGECARDWPLVRAQLGIPSSDGGDAGTTPSEAGDGGAANASPPGDAGFESTAPRGDGGNPQLGLKPRGALSCALGLTPGGSARAFAAFPASAFAWLSLRRRLRLRSRPPAK